LDPFDRKLSPIRPSDAVLLVLRTGSASPVNRADGERNFRQYKRFGLDVNWRLAGRRKDRGNASAIQLNRHRPDDLIGWKGCPLEQV
jgi:hypothetical protein